MTNGPRHPEFIPGRTCINCSDPIPWRPGVAARARSRWCSEACRRKAGRADEPKACLECGQPIPWRESRAARSRAKFCGNACKYAYQAKNPARPRQQRAVKPCGTCGNPVEYLPSQRGIRNGARSDVIYCSRKCKGIGHSAIMLGRRPSNGIYASHHVFRQMMRREFLDLCAICGWDEAPNDVCHIIARKNGGDDSLENVVMLCPNHHRLFDRGRIPVDEIRVARAAVLLTPSCEPATPARALA